MNWNSSNKAKSMRATTQEHEQQPQQSQEEDKNNNNNNNNNNKASKVTADAPAVLKNYDRLIKVVLLSTHKCASGKSAIRTRYTEDTFVSAYTPTEGIDFSTRIVTYDHDTEQCYHLNSASSKTSNNNNNNNNNNENDDDDDDADGDVTCRFKLQLWDTSSADKFTSIMRTYLRGMHVLMIVFAVDDTKSFQEIPDFLDEVGKLYSKDEYDEKGQRLIKVLVGNKSDLPKEQWQVTTSEIEKLALENDFDMFWSVSAKTGNGIDGMFEKIVKFIVYQDRGNIDNQKKKKCGGQKNDKQKKSFFPSVKSFFSK